PDLDAQGVRHPALAGLPEVVRLLQRDKKSVFRRPFPDGERVYEQQITWSPISRRISLYMTDITEWKRLNQLKTELLNTVSHEFRSPLTSLIGTTKMLTSGLLGTLTPDQLRMITMMEGGLARLNRMINNYLDISKLEAGKFSLWRQATDLAGL